MILDKTRKQEEQENFIKKYKAAIESNLSKEQLSNYLGIKPDSLVRRRLHIKDTTGLDLPYLKSTGTYVISDELLRKFRAEIGKLTKENKTLSAEETAPNERDYSKYDRLVIISAQNATPINEGFFAAILNYCKINKAGLVVIPYRYKNPTSVFEAADMDYWDERLVPYLMDRQIKVASNLQIMGHAKIQPTAIQPLYGYDGYTGTDSAIIGHPKIQLKTIPTPSNSLPKILATTGAITLPNYTDSKAGIRGQFHHSYAAAIVEIDRKRDIFHLRHIHWNREDESFFDIARGELKKYTSNEVKSGFRASALITGDSHAVFIDPTVEATTYTNKNSIVNIVQPENLILHDVLDGYSISHHHRHNDIIRYGKHHFDRGNIEKELQITANFIDRVSRDGMKTYIVKSNHDEHFDRWLKEAEPKDDPENARFYHYMKYQQLCSVIPNHTGFSSIDPFEFWCNHPDQQQGLTKKHLVKILKRDESLFINNNELSFHGDKGASGAKGSLISFARVGNKMVVAHDHSCAIYEGVYRVGTSSYIDLEYKSGLDSWMHSHCIIYPDGKRSLINIIRGQFYLE